MVLSRTTLNSDVDAVTKLPCVENSGKKVTLKISTNTEDASTQVALLAQKLPCVIRNGRVGDPWMINKARSQALLQVCIQDGQMSVNVHMPGHLRHWLPYGA